MIFFLSSLFIPAEAVSVIDTQGLEQYKRAHFESHETGWFGLNSEWAQRIYIGDSEEQTTIWMSQMQRQYYKQKIAPIDGEWDEGLGNSEFMIIRMQTLGLLCQGKRAALCIEHLQNRIVDVESSCGAPTTTQNGDLWTVQLPDSDCQMMFQGGHPIYDSEVLQFTELPTTITIYNRYARSWKYTRQGFNTYQILEQNRDSSPQNLPK